MKYTPYCYVIGWSELDTWYCGCEYAQKRKTAHPDNLWTTYFTSSKHVQEYRDKYGEPDVIKVHRTFFFADETRKYESEYLVSIDAASNTHWLNESNGSKDFSETKKRLYAEKVA